MTQKLAKVNINSHNLAFFNIDSKVYAALFDYCRGFISYERIYRGRYQKPLFVKKDSYTAYCKNTRTIRFHINVFDDLFRYLDSLGYKKENFEFIQKSVHFGKTVTLPIKDKREPFDYQIKLIDYILSEGRTKVITLPTGYGKTILSLWAAAKIGKRMVITILGRYVDKWISDVNEAFELDKGDLLVIRGSDDLINLMNLAIEGNLNAKIIIITSTTMYNYLKDYELGQNTYPIKPFNFYEKLDAGLKLIDECHQFFHINFKIDLYTNISKAIFLSATLEPSDKFLDKMYKIIYPITCREQGTIKEKYVDICAFSYSMTGAKKLVCKRNGSYSHVMFENEILSNKKALKSYLELIFNIINDTYICSKKQGQKLLVFASTVAMCTEIVSHLSDKIEDLTIARYTAEDKWDNLHSNDIVVSTIGSAGTAVDIKDLKTCLLTVSVSSVQQNLQVLGRLRKLVNYENDNPEFIYIYCADIPRQRMYHKAKYDLFRSSARTHNHYDLKHKVFFK